ncbi:chromate transporter [Paenibacillus psychroresistens]|uniref:Chromate transporter n=1 Tax=Paenibacillus psychroresistens TaxID=1778678 RepID=A0A6B8RV02_9BACL|nr:chromate transporter [Paenibacillus psychroresistens]QGQ99599.1 chromate transporter [Paenibacillus psychroresistens]
MKNDYWDLSMAMFRTGMLGYGGGPATVPLIRYEAVTRYQWMNNDEFGEVLAIANALPGPIATKLAAYLGYQRKGTIGAIVSVLAHIMPSCIAMVALFSLIAFFKSSSIISGMIAAVVPVVCVMLGIMAYEFGEKAIKGLGKTLGIVFFVLSFLLLQILHLHPAIVIILFLLYGAFHYKLLAKLAKNKLKKGEGV